MASGWAQYAQMVKKCNTQIWGAGIFGHDGTIWGQDGLPLASAEQQAQAKKQVALFCSLCKEDVDTSHPIFTGGFNIFDKDWAIVRLESNMVVSKGKPPNTAQFAARKTGRCIVIAVAHAEGANTNAISGAVQIGEFLEDSGY